MQTPLVNHHYIEVKKFVRNELNEREYPRTSRKQLSV
jgi:hypothetical protein